MRKVFCVLLPCLAALVLLSALAVPAYAGLIGGNLYLSSAGGGFFPDVAFDSVDGKYLVVWPEYAYSPQRIMGRWVSSGGAILGGEFFISDGSVYGLYPAVAYNATNNEFLVTWDDGRGNSMIAGQRVRGSDGALLGGNFLIGSTPGIRSAVAWSSVSNCYMVTYCSTDTLAQRVSNTGTMLGSEVNVSNDSDYSGYPAITYNSATNQFLVTWDSSGALGGGFIAGQRVDAATSNLVGARIAVVPGGAERSYSAYDPQSNKSLVGCNDEDNAGNSFDQSGQLVNADGTLYGGALPLAHTTAFEGETNMGCDIAYATGSPGRYFDVFQYDDSMGGQEVLASGTNTGPLVILGAGTGGPCAVAADSGLGRFLTVWQSAEGATYYVRAQLYGMNPNPPPGPVSNFVATPGVSQINLTWTNSLDSNYTGVMIRYRTDTYPTSITDGTLVIDKSGTPGANDSYMHTGLTNGVNYFYTAFAHNADPSYSGGVTTWAAPDAVPGLTIIPKPQDLTWKTGTGFLINSSTQIVINTTPDDKETNSANELQRKVWDMTGFAPAIVQGSAGSSTTNVIAMGTPARNASVSAIIATYSEANGKASKTEGSMIGVNSTSIVIRGFDDAGTFYGSQTLIQLLEYYGPNRIAPLFCYDYPELQWRGAFMAFKFEHDWSFSKELVKEMYVRYKMNRIWPDYWLPSTSHPEITWPPDSPRPTLAEALDFTNFCELHYLTVIMASYPGNIVDNGQHQSLLENPSVAGVPCWNNPGARTIMNDLWNEQLNAFTGSLYTPSGYTEMRYMGWDSCPWCGPYNNAQLMSQFLWKDRDYLYGTRGVTPIVFGDMLRADMDAGMQTHDAVATMPSEYVIFDWEYGLPGNVPTDYPSLDTWIANGRKACGTPYGFGDHPELNQRYGGRENIYYWANAVYNRSLTYPQYMLGINAWNKYIGYDKRVILDSPLYMTMLECFPYYGEWGWNPNGRYWNPQPYDGKVMVKREISPDRVTNALVTASAGNVTLSWTNPTDSTFTKTYIVYRTDRQPANPLDGTYLADVTGTPGGASNYVHTGAPAVAYYGLFAHDVVRHFSPVVNVQVGGYCFQDSFSYSNGALNGNGGWSGTATSSQIQITSGYVKLNGGAGAYQAIKTVACGDPGTGNITVTVKINGEVGTTTMWNLWIGDSSSRNFARWCGSGTTARGRIGSTANVTATQTLTGGWDTLKVKIYPATNNTEFFFNGVSLGTLSHASEGASDVVGELNFERIDASGATGNYLYFDDLAIGEQAADTTPPGPVTNFTATAGDMQNSLSWTMPGDSDLAGVKIMFKTTGYPTGPADGTQCYSGTGTSTVHTGLTNGATYYYGAYAYDGVPNYSTATQVGRVPADTVAPGNVTAFTATPGTAQNVLAWTKPGDSDLAGVKIMFKTTGYPTGPTDGTQCYTGTGTTYTHTGLTNGTTYYYKAFSFDEVPNYSSGATASGAPFLGFCWEDPFTYSNGALNGNGGWSGSATSAHIAVTGNTIEMFGGAVSKDAIKTVSCGDPGVGYIMVRCNVLAGTGANSMWSLWINDSAGKNFARWYGAGTTCRGRIGGTSTVTSTQNLRGGGVWDSLTIKIIPTAHTSEFFFNGASMGVLNYSSEGTGNTVTQIRIERMDNSGAAGNYLYFDDPRVGGS